jgi:hypothetical protein
VHHEVEAAGHNVAAAVDELKVSTGLSERVADEEAASSSAPGIVFSFHAVTYCEKSSRRWPKKGCC